MFVLEQPGYRGNMHSGQGERGTGRVKVGAVALELTRYCNQKCDYCYNGFRDDPGPAIQGDDRWPARLERLLAQLEIGYVTLTGGEPMAYRGVFHVLSRLAEAGVPSQMISNGGLFDDRMVARLAEHPPRSIQITLNADSAALHDELVGGAGHHERTLAGIAALTKRRIRVVGCMVVNRRNAGRTAAVLSLFERLGVGQVALSRFSPAGYASRHVAELLPRREDLIASFEAATPFAERGMRIQCTMPVPPCAVEVERFGAIHFGGCAIGTRAQEFAVGPDGRMRNCTLHGQTLAEAGDIADPDVDLRALVQGDDVVGYRRVRPSFCHGCSHEASCGGGCGAAAAWVHGSRLELDPFVSQYVDDAFAERLRQARSDKTRTRRALDVIA